MTTYWSWSATFEAWPDTHHPHYDTEAEILREMLAPGHRSTAVVTWANQPEPERPTLRIQKAYGQAPWVGSPFVYMWWVAVDENDRWVAGPAWIQKIRERVWDW
jgi:hypothetical protein